MIYIPAPPGAAGQRWVTAWSGNPVVGSDIAFLDCPAGDGLRGQTVRNVVFLSAGDSITDTSATTGNRRWPDALARRLAALRGRPSRCPTAASAATGCSPRATASHSDGLHPNDAGCRAIADAVDLAALLRG